MKSLFILCLSFICFTSSFAQPFFENERELSQYINSETDLSELNSQYFLNFPVEMDDSLRAYFKARSMPNSMNSVNDLILGLKLLENSDYRQVNRFNMDSVLMPVMDEYYSVTEFDQMNIPLFILANNFAELNSSQKTIRENWTSNAPFPAFNTNEVQTTQIYQFGLFIDSLRNNNISIYWDQSTFISNIDSLEVESIKLKIDGSIYDFPEGQSFDLTPFYSVEDPLSSISMIVKFNNGIRYETVLAFHIEGDPNPTIHDFTTNNSRNNVNVDYAYFPGCVDVEVYEFPDLNVSLPITNINTTNPSFILDKPLILVSGWGPYTNLGIINNTSGWPASILDLYHNYNTVSKKIDVLREQGYDIVLVRFHPPNASIHDNSERLEAVINLVNSIKAQNGSKEENVIMGYSAGALCTRMTLLRMEKNHLENNGPHHHTKLFISFDGENQGAHIPLSMQAAVEDLRDNLIFSYYYALQVENCFAIYGLYYILNAPLSQELLRYYLSQTGTIDNPGQGASALRTNYLNIQSSYNHTKNTFNPDYPSFTRNISISNGRNEPNDLFDQSSFFPYQNEGFTWYEGNSGIVTIRNLEANFEKLGGGIVYKRGTTWFGNWNVNFGRKTDANVLVLDNAPGGSMEVGRNPLGQLVDVMRGYTDNDNIDEGGVQYCFTPAVLTHDIKNYSPMITGGRMEYNFKTNGLMYQNENDAIINDIPNASDFFGYPHLRFPNNHYSDYTPFDAVFTGPENTEHISTNVIFENFAGAREYFADDNPFTITKDTMRNFILNECDALGDALIQNKRYGWNARSNYLYEADIIVPNQIKFGNRVTQRTNFNDVEIWDNAKVYAQAGEEIHIKNGFHAQAGSEFHAVIASSSCINFDPDPPFQLTANSNNPNASLNTSYLGDSENEIVDSRESNFVKIYPNPSTGQVNIEFSNSHNSRYMVVVTNVQGKIVKRIDEYKSRLHLNLEKGIYILRINFNGKWHTKKVVIV